MDQPEPIDISDQVLLATIAFAVGEGTRNAQSLGRWLSAGVGVALGVTVPLVVEGKPALPHVANSGLLLLLLCFIPSVLAEWLAMPLLSLAQTRGKGAEIYKEIADSWRAAHREPVLDWNAMTKNMADAAPWPIGNRLRRFMVPFDQKGLARWYARRANKVRACVLVMATSVPISVAVLVWGFVGWSFCFCK
jgi:hypothetical protein